MGGRKRCTKDDLLNDSNFGVFCNKAGIIGDIVKLVDKCRSKSAGSSNFIASDS